MAQSLQSLLCRSHMSGGTCFEQRPPSPSRISSGPLHGWRNPKAAHMAKVAFLGLGVMGFPMAAHLVKKGGHEVTVFNRTPAKAQAWAEKFGGKTAPTPKAAHGGQDFGMCRVGHDKDLGD